LKMFCEKCGSFISKENLNSMAKTKEPICPKCHAKISLFKIKERISLKKPSNAVVEVVEGSLDRTETISVNCPICGYNKGFSEIIKTGFGDEGDVFVLYCGKCRKPIRREGGPVGWG
jgi:DNA-directed RNA polymerase subunit M/transcription elongation factor TFIIS